MQYSDRQLKLFAKIAYLGTGDAFKEYVIKHGAPVPLQEFLSTVKDGEQTLRDLGITTEELCSWSISNVYDENSACGFYACVIETSPGNATIAFRGSEDFKVPNNLWYDWILADAGLLNSTDTNQHNALRRFFESERDFLNSYDNITVTGHSLGGNLAEYAAIVSNEYGLDDNIENCVSLDGPGFSDEFLKKYQHQIEHMSGKMTHYRWSAVGALLFDLPGVKYNFIGAEGSNFGRHRLEQLIMDGDNFVNDVQDPLSRYLKPASEAIDAPGHDTMERVKNITAFITGIIWSGTPLFENGKLTPAGKELFETLAIALIDSFADAIGYAIAICSLTVNVITKVITYGKELIYKAADAICNAIGELYNWTSQKLQELWDLVVKAVNDVYDWYNRTFNAGYQYANEHPYVRLDTYRLHAYAQRIEAVNRRVSGLDRRMDSLYWRVGFLDLWNLIQADLLTGYSWRLRRCVSYLNDTANDFELAESNLINNL